MEPDRKLYLTWNPIRQLNFPFARTKRSRQALGLPLEEPGRYKPGSFFGKDQYDPTSPLYQYDYWGEPKNSEISKQERMKDAHNKSIVGKGNVWYDMSYDDAVKQTMEKRKDGSSNIVVNQEEDETGDGDDEFEFDDFDYSILSDESSIGLSEEDQEPVVVNGTQVFTD